MVKKKVERLGVETSLLGFGAMRLAVKGDGSIDYETNAEMVDKAVAGGVNYFDTAYVYHGQKSEVFLGEALVAKYPRDSFYVATKLPTFRVEKAEQMEEMLDESLRRLRTDYIDFYLLHSMDLKAWNKMKSFGVVDLIDKAKKDGRIRRIGFSTHANAGEFKAILDDYPGWEFVQIQLNYADWEMDPDIRKSYEIAEAAGIPVIIMEPIRGGSLSKPSSPAVMKLAELLPAGTLPAQTALRWAAERDAAFVILSGMSAVAHVEENVRTFSPITPLSSEEREAIGRTIEVLKSFPTIPCTSCGYCLDGCPVKIPIDYLFDGFNSCLYYDSGHNFVTWYPKEGSRPSDCTNCGACASVCPQKIDIPRELKRVDELYNELK